MKELGGKPKITRFKGLGEISPKEFAQFLGKQIRLRCWRTATSRIRPARRVRAHLQFLHGQEHAGTQGLHHGQPRGAGGGVGQRVPPVAIFTDRLQAQA